MCARNGLSGFRVPSGILKSDASVLTDLTIKSAKGLLVEPPATVELLLWEKRAALDARQSWDIASPREHHQPRVCVLQLVKDSFSHWTTVPNITPKNWIVAFLRRSRPDRVCVPNVKFAERFSIVPSVRKVVCLRVVCGCPEVDYGRRRGCLTDHSAVLVIRLGCSRDTDGVRT